MVVTASSDGSVKSTANEYGPPDLGADRWVLGRLKRATVTHTGPDTHIRVSAFDYDPAGLLIREVVEPDQPNDCLQTTHTYDTFGNRVARSISACPGASGYVLASASAPRTVSSTYSLDGRFPVTTTNALGHRESRDHDPRTGQVTALTGPNNLVTRWQYDGLGRKLKETRPDGTFTTWAYPTCTASGADCPGPIGGAASAWVLVEQEYGSTGRPNAAPRRSYFDAFDRILRVQTTGFDGSGEAPTLVQDTEYNAAGQVARRSQVHVPGVGDPGWTRYAYDALGRVVSESRSDPDAPGGVATTTFKHEGLRVTQTNSEAQVKVVTRNPQGHVAEVVDHLGSRITYRYDALGQLTEVDADGSRTRFTYDRRGHKVAMSDPAVGAWQYAYNAFGELVWQRDSLSQQVSIEYDALGRMTQRAEPDLVSRWSHDVTFGGSSCGKSAGKLCEAAADNGYRRTHAYDALGRLVSTATVLDNAGQPATSRVAYDATTGRAISQTWPTGHQATFGYTATGHLKKVSAGPGGGAVPSVTIDIMAMDAQGRVTRYRHGNQLITVRVFDDATGRLKSQSVPGVLSHAYAHDSLGNLLSRADSTPGIRTQEAFSYDGLNRLTRYAITGGNVGATVSTEVRYDARGNITYKSDVGSYDYDPARPNRLAGIRPQAPGGARVENVGTRTLGYAYDDEHPGAASLGGIRLGNGNLMRTLSMDAANNRNTYRAQTHTSFNMPQTFESGNMTNGIAGPPERTSSFVYGPEHQRVRQQSRSGGTGAQTASASTTWYLHGDGGQSLSYEKEVASSGLVEHRHYVQGGGLVFAILVSRSGTLGGQRAQAVRYLHHDHLGSVVAVTNEAGEVVERLAYDPWGKRRYADGRADTLDEVRGWTTNRGYTLHEHLDDMGAVNMNGRVYDPLVGRFMSADPIVQAMHDLQSHNRYAYVVNNPLAHTDPSGFLRFKLFGEHVHISARDARAVAGIAAAWFIGPVFNGFMGAGLANAAFAGGVAGAVSGGSLKAAVNGAFRGALFYGIGELGGGVALHAAGGCIAGKVSGGDCRSGALSAGFAEGAGRLVPDFGKEGNLIARSAVGGVASVVGGGKFANGATTAAFGYLFNECSHGGCGWDDTKVVITGNYAGGLVGEYGTYPPSLHLEIRIQNSYDVVTIEGQPGEYSVMRGLRLVSGLNNPHPAPAFSMDLSVPKGMTMQQLSTNLIQAASAYQNQLPYNFPLAGVGSMMWGYNSNSYVSGVLMRATGQYQSGVVDAARRGGFLVPGFNKPIPIGPR